MLRFAKYTDFTPVEDFIYRPPVDLIEKAGKIQSEFVQDNADELATLRDIQVDAIEGADTDYMKEYHQNLLNDIDKQANLLNSQDYQNATPGINALRNRVTYDYNHGDLRDIMESKKNYDAFQTTLSKMKDQGLAEKLKQESMMGYLSGTEGSRGGRYNPAMAIDTPDIDADITTYKESFSPEKKKKIYGYEKAQELLGMGLSQDEANRVLEKNGFYGIFTQETNKTVEEYKEGLKNLLTKEDYRDYWTQANRLHGAGLNDRTVYNKDGSFKTFYGEKADASSPLYDYYQTYKNIAGDELLEELDFEVNPLAEQAMKNSGKKQSGTYKESPLSINTTDSETYQRLDTAKKVRKNVINDCALAYKGLTHKKDSQGNLIPRDDKEVEKIKEIYDDFFKFDEETGEITGFLPFEMYTMDGRASDGIIEDMTAVQQIAQEEIEKIKSDETLNAKDKAEKIGFYEGFKEMASTVLNGTMIQKEFATENFLIAKGLVKGDGKAKEFLEGLNTSFVNNVSNYAFSIQTTETASFNKLFNDFNTKVSNNMSPDSLISDLEFFDPVAVNNYNDAIATRKAAEKALQKAKAKDESWWGKSDKVREAEKTLTIAVEGEENSKEAMEKSKASGSDMFEHYPHFKDFTVSEFQQYMEKVRNNPDQDITSSLFIKSGGSLQTEVVKKEDDFFIKTGSYYYDLENKSLKIAKVDLPLGPDMLAISGIEGIDNSLMLQSGAASLLNLSVGGSIKLKFHTGESLVKAIRDNNVNTTLTQKDKSLLLGFIDSNSAQNRMSAEDFILPIVLESREEAELNNRSSIVTENLIR